MIHVKRWLGIRHIRYLWLSWCFWRYWHFSKCPVDADLKLLDDVWEGRA
jgi:hypothetical protein